MTQPDPPDRSEPPQPNGTNSGLISEQELEEVLAQASDLAADLSEEVGAVEKTSQPEKAKEEADDTGNAPRDLDAELQELERLVNTTSAEIDTAEAKSLEPTETPVAVTQPDKGVVVSPPDQVVESDRESGEALAVPDFMSELTDPGEGGGSTSAPVEQPPPSQAAGPATPDAPVSNDLSSRVAHEPKRGVVGTGMMGVVGSGIEAGSAADGDVGNPDGSQKAPPAWKLWRVTLANLIRKLAIRLTPYAFVVSERIISLLEVIDRPFEKKLAVRVRRAIGWLAIATTGTAIGASLVLLF